MKLSWTITEAAYHTGIRERTLAEMADRKEIPHIRLKKSLLFIPSQLEAWLKSHTVEPDQPGRFVDASDTSPRHETLPGHPTRTVVNLSHKPRAGRLLGE